MTDQNADLKDLQGWLFDVLGQLRLPRVFILQKNNVILCAIIVLLENIGLTEV